VSSPDLRQSIVTSVYKIDPLRDERWATFVDSHHRAALFHSKGWLEALRRTYGFQAVALTTSKPSESLKNGLLFCRVQSWLTGPRLISVPFSDHCVPLTGSEEESECLLSRLRREADQAGNKYLEVRSDAAGLGMLAGLTVSATFCLHQLDLQPTLDELFHTFHSNCIRRKIRRAEREGLVYEDGNAEELLVRFYRLTVGTRRRQGIPPQPLSWFRNLIACVGEKLKIRLVSYKGQTAAGILTICHKSTMTYKYACSEPAFHRMGPMQLAIWRAIQDAKENGLLEFDMGRTDWRNQGLLTFKDRWGCVRATLVYLRHPAPAPKCRTDFAGGRLAKRVFAFVPERVLTDVGSLLYHHFA
jgi:hypothetical protein